MAAPSYTEDLTDLNTAEANTSWVEMTGTIGGEAYNANGTPAGADPDYPFIQGLYAVTQDCTKDTSVGSLAYNNGTGTGGHGTDGAYFVWQNYMVASNIGTYAQGGFQICVGSGIGDFDTWYVGGVDKAPYPYGGWVCNVANTTVTPDGTAGTPTTTEQYVGSAVYVAQGSSKGEVHNCDVIRYGRGSAIFEHGDLANGYCTVDGFATVNDYNDPTNGYNRWGLIQNTSGGYLWKGRMQLGTVTNAVDFRDSGKSVFIQWTPKVTANFNLIEIINASSNIEMTGMTFTCLDITTASKGRLLMTDDADVALDSCTFNDMDTFVFSKNANTVTIDNSVFNRCGQVTTGGALFTDCSFNSSTSAVSVSATDLEEFDSCLFVSDGSNHAVDLGIISATDTMNWNCTTSSYATSDGSTGNETIKVSVAASQTLTINVASGATTPSIYNTGTGTVSVVSGQVTAEIEVLDEDTKAAIQDAAVTLKVGSIGNLPYNDSVTITRVGDVATVSHTAHGLTSGKKIAISGADQNEYNRIKTITYIDANSYSYAVYGSPTTPATGTITATAVIVDGVTDSNGKISDTRSYGIDQSFTGLIQKGTGISIYKARPTSGTVTTVNGVSQTILLTKD